MVGGGGRRPKDQSVSRSAPIVTFERWRRRRRLCRLWTWTSFSQTASATTRSSQSAPRSAACSPLSTRDAIASSRPQTRSSRSARSSYATRASQRRTTRHSSTCSRTTLPSQRPRSKRTSGRSSVRANLRVYARAFAHRTPGYQVGVTLENTEKPKCAVDESCVNIIARLDPAERPLDARLALHACRQHLTPSLHRYLVTTQIPSAVSSIAQTRTRRPTPLHSQHSMLRTSSRAIPVSHQFGTTYSGNGAPA